MSEATTNTADSISPEAVTARLQKGGALLPDMRAIVALWEDKMETGDPLPKIAQALPKATFSRIRDTYTRSFRPRFLNGSPPNAWKYARVLEEHDAEFQVIRTFYYWLTARSEAALYGFVTERLLSAHRAGAFDVRTGDAVEWLESVNRRAGREWTQTVTLKTARGILASLRDFGILEGASHKRIAPISLNRQAFSLIAFCLVGLGASGRSLLRHSDWKLFLLGETGVEHMCLEAHQYGWMHFESIGDIVRTEFPKLSFQEYANVVLG